MRDAIRTGRRRVSFVGRHFMALCVAVLVVVLLAAIAGCGTATSAGSATTDIGTVATTPLPTSFDRSDGYATIAYTDLPKQAKETVRLIDAGGPYPYRKDGSVFSNREKLLPRKGSGYYREYTVDTPGSSDRGTRRIIQGKDGTMYYTDDHYRSFRRIQR